MKISRLLVLGALGLTNLSVSAADLIERVKPDFSVVEETPVAFEVGKNYILYNTGANMYFTQGSTWSTRGCVVPNKASAVMIRVAKYTLNDVWDGKTYEIENYVTPRTGSYMWYKMCMNGAGDLYLDQTTWSRFVEIQPQGDNVYRIMPNEVNNTVEGDNGGVVSDGTQFVGYAGLAFDGGGSQYDFGMGDNEDRVPLSALTDLNVDWKFYSTAAYDAAMEVYNKAEELKKLIEQAEEKGVDTNAAAEVYNNEASTLQQIEAAINALGEAIAAGSGVHITGSAANPGDATAVIENPTFEDASFTGWLGTEPNMVGSGSHGPANVAEHYNKNFDTYQNLYGLPAGVYGLSAYTFYRGSWDDYVNGTNRNAFLYATSGEDTQEKAFANPWEALNTVAMAGPTEFGTTAGEVSQKVEETGVTYYIPNDPSAGRVYFEKGYYYNAVAFGVANGSARVGVKKEKAVTNDWSVFDTFALTYYGNEGAASYGAWLGDNAAKLYAAEAEVSEQYVDAFIDAIDAQKASATDAVTANAAYDALKNAPELVALNENIAAWGELRAAVAEAKAKAIDYPAHGGELADAVMEAEDYFGLDLTTDEVLELVADLKRVIEEVIEAAKQDIQPGQLVNEVYDLKNTDFAKGKEGWEGNTNCNAGSGCLEAYNQQFDIYQTVDGPQVGVYELELQGFFRLERDQTAYDKYVAGEQDKTRAWIYINDNKSYVKCVFDEAVPSGVFSDNGANATDGQYWVESNTDNWYPNTMTSANEVFEHGMYKTKAYGLVANAGEQLKLGVAGNMSGANWMIWDNFKLYYKGFDAATIKPVLEEALQNLDLSSPMGKSIAAEAADVNTEAQAAIAANDGTAMFNALKKVFALNTKITESVALFKQLSTALENLNTAIQDYSDSPDIFDALTAYSNWMTDLDARNIEDEDVPGIMDEIAKWMTKLRLPAGYADASDANEVDMTSIINTPTFDKEGANSAEGWNAEGSNFGNDETQKSALLLEFYNKTFDLYQEIIGLPNGVYTLKANAFERLNAESPNPAYLYGESEGKEYAVELKALNEEDGIGDMVTASGAFEEGKYLNEVTFKVTNEKARIGIKKPTNEGSTTDWVIMDNFCLYYYGANSTKELGGQGIETINLSESVKSEYFTLDGRQATAANRGIVIVRYTLNDGTVVVRKVRK